ncbi:hypothetical protein C1H46_013448 [Malus baccata]|uniref:Uncharacterized protein n=1 Tax=Malus baccata TaxID=106549 RepID=A0A540MQ43_MALBA|nr:hypothetical protein C1H46_013448 [Malus baccata]
MQARRKFIMQRPCHMVQVSTWIMGAGTDAAVAVLLFASFIWPLEMFNAVTPQISQVLQIK